jgi:hypothetical protein
MEFNSRPGKLYIRSEWQIIALRSASENKADTRAGLAYGQPIEASSLLSCLVHHASLSSFCSTHLALSLHPRVHCSMAHCHEPYVLLPSEASHPTPPDFGQPPTFAQRVNNVYTDLKITPNWIDNSDCFWYRVRSNPEESTFIYVDPNRSIREPAFNHAELAQALTSMQMQSISHILTLTQL